MLLHLAELVMKLQLRVVVDVECGHQTRLRHLALLSDSVALNQFLGLMRLEHWLRDFKLVRFYGCLLFEEPHSDGLRDFSLIRSV